MEKTNVYGVVLAGGKGTRMGNVEKPKQFMEVGGKPIIIHTLEKFVINPQFERVIVHLYQGYHQEIYSAFR